MESRLAGARYSIRTVGEIERRLQYGCSKRATEEPVGVQMLRMNNLQANGWNLSDIKYVELTDKELASWKLESGDIVFNRTNSKELVGKCEVFREPGTWVFASYLMRLQVDEREAIPEFVSAFLNGPTGRAQIDRESRQIIGMSNINADEIRTLSIPLPKPSEQKRLLSELNLARDKQRKQLADASALLAGLDEFVVEQLGLNLPLGQTFRTTYAIRKSDALSANKLYPDHFHPERLGAIQAVAEMYKGDRRATLSSVIDFRRDQRQIKPDDEYLGLANVQSNTGERVESTEEPGQGAVFEYAENDVLFARLRPYLNKVYRAERRGVCSPEFHVMRIRLGEDGKPRVIPDYLAAVMRSRVVLAQTRHMMTGNTHPRLANEDVVNLVIPIPDRKLQVRVATEVAHRREKARLLRSEAKTTWEQAITRFDNSLLGTRS